MTFHRAVFDYNGTLAKDGRLSPEVKKLLAILSEKISVTVITADTFGSAKRELAEVEGVSLRVLEEGMDGKEKARYVSEAGPAETIVIGNGNNDQAMFAVAGLSICVLGPEGASTGTLFASKVVVRSPEEAIELLLSPQRLIATLRR